MFFDIIYSTILQWRKTERERKHHITGNVASPIFYVSNINWRGQLYLILNVLFNDIIALAEGHNA